MQESFVDPTKGAAVEAVELVREDDSLRLESWRPRRPVCLLVQRWLQSERLFHSQGREGGPVIVFSCSKRGVSPRPAPECSSLSRPQYQLARKLIYRSPPNAERFTPKEGFRTFFRRLRAQFRPAKLEDTLSAESLAEAHVLVIGAPREPFSEEEFAVIVGFHERGGSLLLLAGEGGDAALGTNLNYLLEKFHLSVNSDCVLCTVHEKYLHPKEVRRPRAVLTELSSLSRASNRLAGMRARPWAGA